MTEVYEDDAPELHYWGTTAHCWIAPVGVAQPQWEQYVRAHLVDHLAARESLTRPAHLSVHLELDPAAEEVL